MKKLLFILFAAVSAQLNAQIPNAGFENGTNNIPDNWFIDHDVSRVATVTTTYNSQSYTVNPHSGNYFLKLVTTQEINGPDTTVNLGYASVTIPAAGYPDSFAFNAVYFPQIPEDYFTVGLDFLKWDSASMQSVLVMGTSTNGNSPSGSTWGRHSSDIFYFGGNKPAYDSLRIIIRSANPGQHNPVTFEGLWGINTMLLIDDITLIGGTTGVKKIELGPEVSLYPNPAKNLTSLTYTLTADAVVNLTVYDINGREALAPVSEFQQAGTYTAPVDLSALTNGVYIYRLATENSVQTGKLVVNR